MIPENSHSLFNYECSKASNSCKHNVVPVQITDRCHISYDHVILVQYKQLDTSLLHA